MSPTLLMLLKNAFSAVFGSIASFDRERTPIRSLARSPRKESAIRIGDTFCTPMRNHYQGRSGESIVQDERTQSSGMTPNRKRRWLLVYFFGGGRPIIRERRMDRRTWVFVNQYTVGTRYLEESSKRSQLSLHTLSTRRKEDSKNYSSYLPVLTSKKALTVVEQKLIIGLLNLFEIDMYLHKIGKRVYQHTGISMLCCVGEGESRTIR
jgi:hypothetical protein